MSILRKHRRMQFARNIIGEEQKSAYSCCAPDEAHRRNLWWWKPMRSVWSSWVSCCLPCPSTRTANLIWALTLLAVPSSARRQGLDCISIDSRARGKEGSHWRGMEGVPAGNGDKIERAADEQNDRFTNHMGVDRLEERIPTRSGGVTVRRVSLFEGSALLHDGMVRLLRMHRGRWQE